MSPLSLAINILRYFGPRIVWLRAGVYLRNSLGVTRRIFASRSWDDIAISEIVQSGTPADPEGYAQYKRVNAPPFIFPLGRPPRIPDTILRAPGKARQPTMEERVRLLRQDRCVYFFRFPSPNNIDWYSNPFDQKRSDPSQHFSRIADYLPDQGDPRMLWEPSRAAWALDCGKAASYGQFEDAGAIYWRWVDSWMEACPPYQGFQWKCGQESMVRLLAILFGFWALAEDATTSPRRFQQIARLAWATGHRIYHHIQYAISQKNNHATSEACGLLLIAQLFPEFREAARWRSCGRRVLENEVRRQVYEDGSYVQHSFNYQRVMMQGVILSLRLAELAQCPFDRSIYELLGRCGEFLFELMDSETGRMPMYGNNDGAYILPLSECDFLDFRPVIQAAHYTVYRERKFPSGPWDEDLVWLFGPESLEKSNGDCPAPVSSSFDAGGYSTLRQKDSWCMLRSHMYRDRPAHCDQLHLDLWWRGQNILRDCGTYHYYVPGRPDLEYYYKSIRAHNTVEVDDANPLELASRFLWFPWPRGRRRDTGIRDTSYHYLEAEHYDYDRKPWNTLHRRIVVGLGEDLWVVIDDLLSHTDHNFRLRWHLADCPCRYDAAAGTLELTTKKGTLGIAVAGTPNPCDRFAVVRGSDVLDGVQGFASAYYGEQLPIPTLEADWRGCSSQRMITTICPGVVAVPRLVGSNSNRQRWSVETPHQSHYLELTLPDRSSPRTLLHYEMASRPTEVP